MEEVHSSQLCPSLAIAHIDINLPELLSFEFRIDPVEISHESIDVRRDVVTSIVSCRLDFRESSVSRLIQKDHMSMLRPRMLGWSWTLSKVVEFDGTILCEEGIEGATSWPTREPQDEIVAVEAFASPEPVPISLGSVFGIHGFDGLGSQLVVVL